MGGLVGWGGWVVVLPPFLPQACRQARLPVQAAVEGLKGRVGPGPLVPQHAHDLGGVRGKVLVGNAEEEEEEEKERVDEGSGGGCLFSTGLGHCGGVSACRACVCGHGGGEVGRGGELAHGVVGLGWGGGKGKDKEEASRVLFFWRRPGGLGCLCLDPPPPPPHQPNSVLSKEVEGHMLLAAVRPFPLPRFHPSTHLHRPNQPMASASAAAGISFSAFTSAELRQWVEEHPGHVEDLDKYQETVLYAAAREGHLDLVEWLVDTQGADVNVRSRFGRRALHVAVNPAILRALLARKADPTVLSDLHGQTVLMRHVHFEKTKCIAYLLQDTRVVDTLNVQSPSGSTALHIACHTTSHANQSTILRLLLAAGADTRVLDQYGHTPLQVLRGGNRVVNAAAVAVLEEEVPDAERAACLLRIRRLVMKDRGVTLTEEEGGGGRSVEEEEWRKMAAFVVGVGGGCPKDVFTVVMDLLLPVWAPLRKGLGGAKKPGTNASGGEGQQQKKKGKASSE